MSKSQKFTILTLLTIVALILNLSLGSVEIPFLDSFKSLLGTPLEDKSLEYILWSYRIPKAITALFVGASLALSGLLMQTLFRNPLAGPFVLGISSGASLGVALLIMGASLFGISHVSTLVTTLGASIGSFLVLSLIGTIALRVKDSMSLLIIGIMFGSITAAVVSVLSFLSSKEELQQFIYWSLGNLGAVDSTALSILVGISILSFTVGLTLIKPLNALLLGESNARNLGVSVKNSRILIIIITGLLAGTSTAIVGPIAFLGLAIPHLCRLWFNTVDHKILYPASLISGTLFMLICDTISQLPYSSAVLPINAITSIIGAPIVIWLLIRKKKMHF
jgi:iron complex transport system permease protein